MTEKVIGAKSLDALMAEVSRRKCPKGFTTAEMAQEADKPQDKIQRQLRALIRAGRVRFVGRKQSMSIDGKQTMVPVYQFTPVGR